MSDNYYKVYLYGVAKGSGFNPSNTRGASYEEMIANMNTLTYSEPVEIMDNNEKAMTLINPRLSLAVDGAGNFEFTMPRNHVFYDAITPYGSTIAVTENDNIIFIGRPLPPTVDFWGQKTFHCEGALAFLNDTVLYHYEPFNPISAGDYIAETIAYHNSMAGREDRQFIYGFTSQFSETNIYDPDPWDYQTAFDFLRNYLHQFISGHFYVDYQDFNAIELCWISDNDLKNNGIGSNNQPISCAVNMTDITQSGREFYTAAIAKGGEDEDGNTPYMMNPVINYDMVAKYGFICKFLEYPDVHTEDALEAYCQAFLEEEQFEGIVLDVSAADLHPLNTSYNEYKLMQLVRVNADQFGFSITLPITRIEIDLTSGVKHVTIGEVDKVSLTISTQKALVEEEQKAKEIAKREKEKSDTTTITGSNGEDYTLDIDENGNVVATKVPQNLLFTKRVPYFLVGDSLDMNDYEVTAYYANSSKVVTDLCSYNVADGYTFTGVNDPARLIAVYTESGKRLTAQTALNVIKTHGKKIVLKGSMLYEGKYGTGVGHVLCNGYLNYTYIIESLDDEDIYIARNVNEYRNGGTYESPANYEIGNYVLIDYSVTNPKIRATFIYDYYYKQEAHSTGGWQTGEWADSVNVSNIYSSIGSSRVPAVSTGSSMVYPPAYWPDHYDKQTFSRSRCLGAFGYYSRWPTGDNPYYAWYNIDSLEVE